MLFESEVMLDIGLPLSLLWLELLLVVDLWLDSELLILLSVSEVEDEEVYYELLLLLASFLGEGKACLLLLVEHSIN